MNLKILKLQFDNPEYVNLLQPIIRINQTEKPTKKFWVVIPANSLHILKIYFKF